MSNTISPHFVGKQMDAYCASTARKHACSRPPQNGIWFNHQASPAGHQTCWGWATPGYRMLAEPRSTYFFVTRKHHSLLKCRAGQSPPPPPPQGNEGGSTHQGEPSGLRLLPTSILTYGALVGVASLLGRQYNVAGQLTSQFQFEASLKYLAAMCVLLVVSTALANVAPSFKELKELFQRLIIPQMRIIPLWGLALMALGAGIGEEALFRGCLQTWVIQQAALVPGTSRELADAAGVFVASVVFGAAHSITASYFVFATVAGAVFGIEYLNCGLPATAFTHAVYDFIAFIAIIQLWGTSNDK